MNSNFRIVVFCFQEKKCFTVSPYTNGVVDLEQMLNKIQFSGFPGFVVSTWHPFGSNKILFNGKISQTNLIRTVVALVTNTDEGGGTNIGITDHTLPVTLLTQPS